MDKMVTYLCIKDPEQGSLTGTCCVCGKPTQTGFKRPFSEKFVGYAYLHFGNCLCPHCYAFFKDQTFRLKSWVATSQDVMFLTREACLQTLLDPPTPPFAIYLTQSMQRQGWLGGLHCVNYDRDKFYLLTDFAGQVLIARKEAEQINTLIQTLRTKKISKEQLLSGKFKMYTYQKALEEGWQNLLEAVRPYIKTPLWEVIVYVNP